jgi:hypothetical protein
MPADGCGLKVACKTKAIDKIARLLGPNVCPALPLPVHERTDLGVFGEHADTRPVNHDFNF